MDFTLTFKWTFTGLIFDTILGHTLSVILGPNQYGHTEIGSVN